MTTAAMAATNNVNCGWAMLIGDGGRDWRGLTAKGDRLGSFLMTTAATATGEREGRQQWVAATGGSDERQ